MRRKLRIYVETSVISHLDAPDRPDRMAETLFFWEDVVAGKYEISLGAPVLIELEKCYEPKRTFMLRELGAVRFDLLEETDESRRLAGEYVRLGGLPKRSFVDATHIALATLAGCDMIVSWNFAHIVNIRAMSAVDAVNTLERLKSIRILSPTALLGG